MLLGRSKLDITAHYLHGRAQLVLVNHVAWILQSTSIWPVCSSAIMSQVNHLPEQTLQSHYIQLYQPSPTYGRSVYSSATSSNASPFPTTNSIDASGSYSAAATTSPTSNPSTTCPPRAAHCYSSSHASPIGAFGSVLTTRAKPPAFSIPSNASFFTKYALSPCTSPFSAFRVVCHNGLGLSSGNSFYVDSTSCAANSGSCAVMMVGARPL